MKSSSMSQRFDAIAGARNKIVNAALIATAVFSFLGFAISILRSTSVGWQLVMTYQIAFWVVIASMAVFRHRLPFLARAWVLIGMLLGLCLTGLVSFGLIGMSIPGLLMTTVLATLLFGAGVGWVIAGVSVAMIAAVGVGVSLEWISFEFDAAAYVVAPTSWAMAVVATVFFIGFCNVGLSWTQGALTDSLRILEEHRTQFQHSARLAELGHYEWDEVTDQMKSCSEEFARICGVTVNDYLRSSATLATGVKWIHPDDREVYIEAHDHYRKVNLESRTSPVGLDIEYRIVRQDGEVRHVRELGAPLFNDASRLVRSIGTLQDMTERVVLEDQFRQAQKVEAIGQLTGGVAHDFNNVLAIILGNLDLLHAKLEDKVDRDEYLAPAIEATKRGATLTHRLLAFARKQALDVRDVDVEALVDGMHDMLRRSLGETIEIKVVNPAGLWLCEVDPAQLEQALLNLAINARDAMPVGGRLIIEMENTHIDEAYADAHVEVSPGDYVLLAVSDNGTGMSPEVREMVFEPFFTTKDVGQGTGLGLSMVFGFVKQSAGHITVYSEEGEGTTVRLYMPRSRATAATPLAIGGKETPRAKPDETILVAEDDVNFRRVIKAMLEDLGYAVIVASEGREALEILSTTPRVDLLLTDVVMSGGISGTALAEAAHRDRARLRVVYMSGYTRNAIVHHGRLDPGVELLAKPFNIEDLGRKLRAVLDG